MGLRLRLGVKVWDLGLGLGGGSRYLFASRENASPSSLGCINFCDKTARTWFERWQNLVKKHN